jgi:hypothetical protein
LYPPRCALCPPRDFADSRFRGREGVAAATAALALEFAVLTAAAIVAMLHVMSFEAEPGLQPVVGHIAAVRLASRRHFIVGGGVSWLIFQMVGLNADASGVSGKDPLLPNFPIRSQRPSPTPCQTRYAEDAPNYCHRFFASGAALLCGSICPGNRGRPLRRGSSN